MRKLIAVWMVLGMTFLFGADIDRRVKLLEIAVVKLINENKTLKKEIDKLKTTSKINTQMIFKLNDKLNTNKIKHNDKNKTFFARVTALKLNIREKPDLKSRIIGILKQDNLVEIKGATLDGNTIWYKIDKGYISSNYTALVYKNKGEEK